jgi:hypothetical protein
VLLLFERPQLLHQIQVFGRCFNNLVKYFLFGERGGFGGAN